MDIENKDGVSRLQEQFLQSIKKIDQIYSNTVASLEKLHQEKMKLIEDYKERLKEEEINKLREDIKKQENN
jgi:hypothetical protein